MKAILIGTGAVGSAVKKALEEKGHQAVSVGRKSGNCQADISDPNSLKALFSKVGPFEAVACAAGELPRGVRINCISPTVLTEAVAAHPYFPGFIPVDAAEVGQAYLRAISNPFTGRIFKLHKTGS
jgi:nucleoside-diphosphate-sugar epimerase